MTTHWQQWMLLVGWWYGDASWHNNTPRSRVSVLLALVMLLLRDRGSSTDWLCSARSVNGPRGERLFIRVTTCSCVCVCMFYTCKFMWKQQSVLGVLLRSRVFRWHPTTILFSVTTFGLDPIWYPCFFTYRLAQTLVLLHLFIFSSHYVVYDFVLFFIACVFCTF